RKPQRIRVTSPPPPWTTIGGSGQGGGGKSFDIGVGAAPAGLPIAWASPYGSAITSPGPSTIGSCFSTSATQRPSVTTWKKIRLFAPGTRSGATRRESGAAQQNGEENSARNRNDPERRSARRTTEDRKSTRLNSSH